MKNTLSDLGVEASYSDWSCSTFALKLNTQLEPAQSCLGINRNCQFVKLVLTIILCYVPVSPLPPVD